MHRETSGDRTMTAGVAEAPPLGQYYEVGGRRLLLHRSGSGSPAVVILPGAGTVGLDYFNIHERAAELTTSVIYDRAGTGWSDRLDAPRTSGEVTDELRALLQAADVPAPYLFVGHSLGGLYARHYAQRFPDEVAGLVLLDPAHEDYSASMPEELQALRSGWNFDQELPDEFPEEVIQFYRALFEREMTGWPAPIREVLVERHVSPAWARVGFREAKDVDRQYEEVRHGGPLPDVPLIVLSSMETDDFKRAVSAGESESLLQGEIDAKWRLYAALAASVPRGEIRPVAAGHVTIAYRCPDAVLQAIQDVLDTPSRPENQPTVS